MATPTQQTFIIDQHKQLIDLNKDLVNFNLNFKIVSTSGAPFQAVVATQKQLDNNMNLQYKNSNPDGTLSGNIVADKNVPNNYILVLKSENQCEVSVTIDCKPIQPNPANNMPQQQPQQTNNMQQRPPPNNKMMPPGGGQRFGAQQQAPNGNNMPVNQEMYGQSQQLAVKETSNNWKYIITGVVILAGGAILYYLYTKKKSDTNQGENKDAAPTTTDPVVATMPETKVEVAPEVAPVSQEAPQPSGGGEGGKVSSLLSRLQGLNFDDN